MKYGHVLITSTNITILYYVRFKVLCVKLKTIIKLSTPKIFVFVMYFLCPRFLWAQRKSPRPALGRVLWPARSPARTRAVRADQTRVSSRGCGREYLNVSSLWGVFSGGRSYLKSNVYFKRGHART